MTCALVLLSVFSAAGAESTDFACRFPAAECRKAAAAALPPHNAVNTVPAISESKDAMKNAGDKELTHHGHFRYSIDRVANPSGDVVVLLHGSGVDGNHAFFLCQAYLVTRYSCRHTQAYCAEW